MIKKYAWIILVILSVKAQAQYKQDIIVLGGSAAGAAIAIQAARSGVKTLLISPNKNLIGELDPSLNIPAFNFGLWKEWRDLYIKLSDSTVTDARNVLESIIKKTKDLQYLNATEITSIEEKKGGWEIKATINGKTENIKCKVLVDANPNLQTSLIAQNKWVTFDNDGKFNGLVSYDVKHQKVPYQQLQKLYRTSGAAGFGKDSADLHTIPLGIFIPQEKENLLIVSPAAFKGFKPSEIQNTALWINIGQSVGALAAYGPFFNTTPSKANVRLTQGEMFTYHSFLYPVLDIDSSDYAWYPIQKIIASGLLKLDFEKGLFMPNEVVKTNDIKSVLSELYPRSRIWFIENKTIDEMAIKDAISAFSFITGRDAISIKQEVELDWKNKYKFASNYSEDKPITKKELAVLLDAYIAPFNIRVDFNGYFLR